MAGTVSLQAARMKYDAGVDEHADRRSGMTNPNITGKRNAVTLIGLVEVSDIQAIGKRSSLGVRSVT